MQKIIFEVPQPEAAELEHRLAPTGLEIDARSVSGMGGILDSIVFVLPLVADTIEIVRAFFEAFPMSKPTSIIIRSGGDRIVIETAEMSVEEIYVNISKNTVNVKVEK